MVFITVGTYKGDDLVKASDSIAPDIDEEMVIQIGQSSYQPKNCRFFRFADSLKEYFNKARVVIGHGGVGTIFEVLGLGKHYIGTSSTAIPDRHQTELLDKLSSEDYILWCKDIKDLRKYIELSKTFNFKRYMPPVCFMDQVILNLFAP